TEQINTQENHMALENTQADSNISKFTLEDYHSSDLRNGNLAIQKINTAKKSPTDQLISGTYIHPDLVPSVAGWVSPHFQIMANRVINGYIVAQYKAQLSTTQLALQHATEM